MTGHRVSRLKFRHILRMSSDYWMPERTYTDRFGQSYTVVWNGQRTDPSLLSTRVTLPDARWAF